MKAKKNVIKLKTDNMSVFTVIGISSHENDYRLSWSINDYIGLAFSQNDSLVADSGKEFTLFVHEDSEKRLTIISNRCDNGFLLEKHKNLDFFLKFDALLSEAEISAWLHELRKVPLVSTAYHIPVDKKVLQLLG